MMIRPAKLTKDAFSHYGDVIEANGTPMDINNGTCARYDDLGRAETDAGGAVALSVFVATPRQLPLGLEMFERHPHGSQAFLPMGQSKFCVVVTGGDEKPDIEGARAFIAGPTSGVNIKRGVWHHPLIAIGTKGMFWVVDRKGEGDNLECFDIHGRLELDLGPRP